MGNVINIDDGVETFEIKNKSGKSLCFFCFNPSDIGILSRHNEVSKNIESMALSLTKENISELEKTEKAEAFIKEQFDYLFNADVSNSFFGVLSPLTVLSNGQLFSEHVLNAISEVVENRTGERLKKIKVRIGKYTKKYHG